MLGEPQKKFYFHSQLLCESVEWAWTQPCFRLSLLLVDKGPDNVLNAKSVWNWGNIWSAQLCVDLFFQNCPLIDHFNVVSHKIWDGKVSYNNPLQEKTLIHPYLSLMKSRACQPFWKEAALLSVGRGARWPPLPLFPELSDPRSQMSNCSDFRFMFLIFAFLPPCLQRITKTSGGRRPSYYSTLRA